MRGAQHIGVKGSLRGTSRFQPTDGKALATDNAVLQGPRRVGGFGGVEGLADYLTREGITHVVDATHPFAAQMSRNAIAASGSTTRCRLL